METAIYKVIGVMSGTSLDGMDLAQIEFRKRESWEFKLGVCETVPYPQDWFEALRGAMDLSRDQLLLLNQRYTEFLGNVISDFVNRNNLDDIDFVASHGHTVLHQPQKKLTLQIGNLPAIADVAGLPVVCDFRVADVMLGGQGAPLVPIGDKLLFGNYDYCLNLGGFANVSMEDPTGTRIAYDICAVNTVMNHFATLLGENYDDRGKMAASGSVNESLKLELDALDFYRESPPKSLGMEWVSQHVLPIFEKYEMEPADHLRTWVAHIAEQIGSVFSVGTKVLVTGGGAMNDFLMKEITAHTDADLEIPDRLVLEYKEALIFGLLGVLKMRNEINCLKSVTGASHDHSSGVYFTPIR
ncbi:anhydro-N-acetylmuramic acid kinase [Robertkochia solimangrovi]|uniref:anhydro-N-acetylmuramic acid kinase n=1 Tax=Robertkochia solimangrovi TaxID=2213046 RepID=UPI00117F3BC5|nr:anhydro-N-acetylmuramic acid kinase [Robertkochia solimangrovi]TRZ44301.1 anhydro-N-acetylmuramic acid kinase [Robertkochia solimangrovi]